MDGGRGGIAGVSRQSMAYISFMLDANSAKVGLSSGLEDTLHSYGLEIQTGHIPPLTSKTSICTLIQRVAEDISQGSLVDGYALTSA